MIVFINGSINAGKSTVAKILAERIGNAALVEIDVLREMIGWMPIDRAVPINLKNALSAIKNFADEGLNIIVPYPLSRKNYGYLKKGLTGIDSDIFFFTLAPELESDQISLPNRHTKTFIRENNRQYRTNSGRNGQFDIFNDFSPIIFMGKPAGKIITGNVCFIVDKENNKVLLLKRNRAPMQSMYTGVGGKTLPEESPFDSCVREAKEETGLDISEVNLRGVVKTIFDGGDSSWILWVYTAGGFRGKMIECGEGKLEWVDINTINSRELIGFIRKIMPYILDESVIFDGVIIHDIKGNVIKDSIKTYSAHN